MPPPLHPHSHSPAPPTQHPLRKLRRLTLVTAALGIALSLFAIFTLTVLDVSSSQIPPFLLAIILFLVSLVVVGIDLHTYAARQHRQTLSQLRTSPQQHLQTQIGSNGDRNPNAAPYPPPPSSPPSRMLAWPTKALLITDLILTFLFQWLFWATFSLIVNSSRPWNYYGGGAEMMESYANLASLVASVCHGIAFWKEVVARKRAAWEREREDVEAGWVCAGCGVATDGGNMGQRVTGEGDSERYVVGGTEDVGKKSGFGGVRFPKWATGLRGKGEGGANSEAGGIEGVDGGSDEPTVTEPLLSTPDESGTEVGAASASEGGYRTLGRSVDSMPETVVRKKEKGKKRLVDVE